MYRKRELNAVNLAYLQIFLHQIHIGRRVLQIVIKRQQNTVIGNIMYTRAKLVDEAGTKKEILTFGPVCVLPEYQRMGYGKMLIEHSFERAEALGYDVIVIFSEARPIM